MDAHTVVKEDYNSVAYDEPQFIGSNTAAITDAYKTSTTVSGDCEGSSSSTTAHHHDY